LMREYWINLVKTAAIAEPTQVVQERKMHLGQVWEVPGLAWDAGFPITPRQLGYQPNSTKLTQLTRTYFNQESLEAANRKLVSRIKAGKTQTSVGASLVAGGKREESQGHCMRAITVTTSVIRIGTTSQCISSTGPRRLSRSLPRISGSCRRRCFRLSLRMSAYLCQRSGSISQCYRFHPSSCLFFITSLTPLTF